MVIRVVIILLVLLSIISLLLIALYALPTNSEDINKIISAFISDKNDVQIVLSVSAIFIMAITVLVSMCLTNMQIKSSAYSTQSQINKIQEQIETVQKETTRHLETIEEWANLARKQKVAALIKEFEHNIILYEQIIEHVEKDNFFQKFDSFIMISMEEFLKEPPTDIGYINHNVLVIYYLVKLHETKIQATRTPNITKDSLKVFFNSIADDYSENKEIIELTLKGLRTYRDDISSKIQSEM